jgi:putative methyltransferase (TIGR04325 family)
MNWKVIVRKAMPAFVVDLYGHYRQGTRPGSIWEGVYAHYRDVPAKGAPFDSASWADSIRPAAAGSTAAGRHGAEWASGMGDHALLAALGAVIAGKAGTLTVLDYGGGAGEGFARLAAGIVAHPGSMCYHVVETPVVCETARRFWGDDQRIQFHTTLPLGVTQVDIVYLSSVLQYIEDYDGLIARLCDYRPQYFLFAKLSAGQFPTYASAQINVSGAVIPYWFINGGELIDRMRQAGYQLLLKTALEREYDQSNFPNQYRLGRACNLLFARSLA